MGWSLKSITKSVSKGISDVTGGALGKNNWINKQLSNPINWVAPGLGTTLDAAKSLMPKSPKLEKYSPDGDTFSSIYSKSMPELGDQSMIGLQGQRVMGNIESPAMVQYRRGMADALGQANSLSLASTPQLGAGLATGLALRNQENTRRNVAGEMSRAKLLEDTQNLAQMGELMNLDRNAQIEKERLRAGAIQANNAAAQAKYAAKMGMMGSILNTAGTLGGAAIGGPAGAAVGGAATSGLVNSGALGNNASMQTGGGSTIDFNGPNPYAQ